MPWKETDAMKERVSLVLEWERRWKGGKGRVNVSELCREFGVSRECGYKWIRRYWDAGRDVRAVEERSRRPKNSPTAVDEEMQDVVVSARKAHPRWGPRKLRAVLVERHPGIAFPSASAIAAILKRRGFVLVRRRRRRSRIDPDVSPPFAACAAPNHVWCVDFKGWFLTRDGRKCYPLTITDAFSRYVLRCEALSDPDGMAVYNVFDSVFSEFGLPIAIRSDGGPPFASTGPAGLTALSVWWLRLGIRVERIAPGKPQQNGRHERMHRTLKADVPPQGNVRRQQAAFDLWRREFNDERPHEALALRPPTRIYVPSKERYPRKLLRPDIADWDHVASIDKTGSIRFAGRKVFVSSALRNLEVELERTDEHAWNVRWGRILLGRIDHLRLDRGLVPTRRPRDRVTVLSLSPDDSDG
jgi:transposase InsO family protein